MSIKKEALTDTACPYCKAENGRIYFSGEMEFTTWQELKRLMPGLSEEMGFCIECGAWIGIPALNVNQWRKAVKK